MTGYPLKFNFILGGVFHGCIFRDTKYRVARHQVFVGIGMSVQDICHWRPFALHASNLVCTGGSSNAFNFMDIVGRAVFWRINPFELKVVANLIWGEDLECLVLKTVGLGL